MHLLFGIHGACIFGFTVTEMDQDKDNPGELHPTTASCSEASQVNPNQDSVLQRHVLNLQKTCRFCGQRQNERMTSKHTYSDIFREFFSTDVSQDDENVHPPNVCDKHRSMLRRVKEARDNGKQYKSDASPICFFPHSTNCSICSPPAETTKQTKGVGRKRKSASHKSYPQNMKTLVAATVVPDEQAEPKKPDYDDAELLVQNYTTLSSHQKDNFIDKLLPAMTGADKAKLAYKLGQNQASEILGEAIAISDKYKSLTELVHYDVPNFVQNSNGIVTSFIEGCCNVSNNKNMYQIGLTIEMLYRMRYPSCIAPLSFMRNLLFYVGHDRSRVMKMNGASGPGGSYTTVTDWVKGLATLPPTCPDGDIITVFDNDQVIGRTWKVRPDNKVSSSVITNIAWIVVQPDGHLQTETAFLPGKWLGPDNDEKVLQATRKITHHNDDYYDELDLLHRKQFTLFVQSAITEVVEEQISNAEGYMHDHIDNAVEAAATAKIYQTCPACKSLVLRRKRTCTNPRCAVNLKEARERSSTEQGETSSSAFEKPSMQVYETEQTNEDQLMETRYGHVTHNHPEVPPDVIVSDPAFVNPNSYESLTAVLRKIGQDAGITRYGGNKRSWMIVCCDGLPYHLCMKLIKETWICRKCSECIFGSEKMDNHLQHTCKHSSAYREFDWVLLKIGGGHYEMNMFKSFVELNWEPFLSDLASTLSFKSPLAQLSAKRCDDTHKTWALLLTFHIATLQELVLEYVRDCLAEDSTPTPSGFDKYARGKHHIPNFYYTYDQVRKYSQAMLNFRIGMRRNNADLIRSAKYTFQGVFHGRSHPIYSIIEINDSLQYQVAPPPIKAFLDKHASISRSGDESKGQDADFILEEINKETKSWIPRGVPDDDTWQRVCRNLPHLRSIKTKMAELTNTAGTARDGYRDLDIEPGVHAWRIRLRETRYLLGNNEQHTSISGKPLHANLVKFRVLADGKRSNHISALFDDETVEDTKPVFITQKEETEAMSVERNTIAQIKEKISQAIPELVENDDDQKYFFGKYDQVKNKKKAELVKLYYEIQNYHGEQTHATTDQADG